MSTLPQPQTLNPGNHSDLPLFVKPHGTFVSLYAGAGGLDMGFSLAGFAPVWTNDSSSSALATHRAAHEMLLKERPHLSHRLAPKNMFIEGDILSMKNSFLPPEKSADIVIGGPPCQGFSVAGKQAQNDVRSQHVFTFLNMVDRVKPRAFVMENVQALAVQEKWFTTRKLLEETADVMGYSTVFMVLNAANYSVPQSRERLFFMGFRDREAPHTTPPPTPKITVRETFSFVPPLGSPGNETPCGARIVPMKKPIVRRTPYAGMLFNGAGRPLNNDSVAPTLTASMGGNATPMIDFQSLSSRTAVPWFEQYHQHLAKGGLPVTSQDVPAHVRRITVLEAAALHSFPANMPWHGPQTSKYRQIGNSVPPRLAYRVATLVRDVLG